ncbi:B12-binding domain-containing radical SAM protein [bacterium]|nr:B12-binding domain-containing radical SAM protein [bacterium]MCI0602949.1 B12-binding domain-containing radical SAM protein [bacterium]
MKKSHIDLLLVNAPGKKRVYQSLANDLAAYEPPIWAGLIGNSARKHGYGVGILDAEAELLTYEETVSRILEANPVLTVFVVYGQQPSASTQCMPAAGDVARMIKEANPALKIMFIGTHPSALPEKTLREEATDFVCQGEGPYTILGVLEALKSGSDQFRSIGGLWYMENGTVASSPVFNNIKNLEEELPGMAWDLLPMKNYKAHNWHCWDHIHDRQPYASLYASFGCPYKCSFCCINAPFGGSGIRYFSPQSVIKEIDILVNDYGVKNIKFADEMFVLKPAQVLGICDLIIERSYKLNIWAYARVDTIRDPFLEKLKKAGFNWLGIGIESGSKYVRDGVEKGRFGDEDIAKIVAKTRAHGIYVGANYIFGLPDDTFESMQATLDLALQLNTEWANFYSAMAYPGSPLHKMAVDQKLPLPENEGGPGWIGYSQHAFETLPLPTNKLSSGEVLAFRDHAFHTYFSSPNYLGMMRTKFGQDVLDHVQFMTNHKLERKYAAHLNFLAKAETK